MNYAALLVIGSFAFAMIRQRASVITLENQLSLFKSFKEAWYVWPELDAHMHLATKNDVRRGEGLCWSLLAVLRADELQRETAPSLIFEPDALPFPGVNYSALPQLGIGARDIYFLGGHNAVIDNQTDRISAFWTKISFIYGTYGIALSPRGRWIILPRLEAYCNSSRSGLSIDIFLAACFDAVVATPLLVDHPREGYSETWKKNKTWTFAGNRKWWRIVDRSKPYDNKGLLECT
jgi:hypothetical protein